ncbi:MAG: hypothetical protein AAB692_01150, partial [Patescibacteria group bacterium]
MGFVAANDGWAVGAGGVIVRWNGTAWSTVASATTQDLFGIAGATGNDVWAVGSSGKIMHWNGTAWSEFVDTGANDFAGIFMVSSTDGWAVSSAGKIFRWNGTAWSEFVDTGNQKWSAVSMVSLTDGWIVGDGGEIRRWNGAAWNAFVDTGTEVWSGVAMVAAADGWIVGNGGAIRRWNGAAWNVVTSPTSNDLYDVIFDRLGNTGWAVGATGKIIRYGVAFFTSGTYIGPVFDNGSSTSWDRIQWTVDLPSGGAVTVATRSGNVAVPDGTWSAFSAELTNPAGSAVASPDARYFQYRLTYASDGAATPFVDDVTVNSGSPSKTIYYGIDMVS